MRMRSAPAVLVVALLAALAPGALAAPPAPYGHACAPSSGALLCATADDAARVPSFDGVPLDVDVWLPATGNGPFPTIAMLHGFGGSKTRPRAATPRTTPRSSRATATRWSRRARAASGARAACPTRAPAPARAAGCTSTTSASRPTTCSSCSGRSSTRASPGPDALGVTGVSYGGGTSLQLAVLRNRVRLLNGTTGPWTSPAACR